MADAFEYGMLANNATWTETSVSFKDTTEAYKYFKFIRKAIMDAHIMLNKPIGFDLTTSDMVHGNGEKNVKSDFDPEQSLGNKKPVSRHPNLCESNLELANFFKHYVFAKKLPTVYRICVQNGDNDMDTNPFKCVYNPIENEGIEPTIESVKPIILSTNKHICKCLGATKTPLFLTLYTMYSCGYWSASKCSAALSNTYNEFNKHVNCFPIATSFDLIDYVKILPTTHSDNKVYYRLENGMTPEILGNIFTDYIKYLSNEINMPSLHKEDLEWFQHL